MIWDIDEHQREQRRIAKMLSVLVALMTFGSAVIALLLMVSAAGHAVERTYRNTMGQEVGRSTTDTRGNTTFRDNMGRETGRSVTDSRGNTTVYDNMGRQTGTVTGWPERSNK